MADDIERDPVTTDTPVAAPRHRKHWLWRILAVLVLGPVVVIGLWVAITLSYSYEKGQHPGYVQKFSRTGWLCKTWEGELAMVNIPGSAPTIFRFSVRDDDVAQEINETMGKQVALTYVQHKGVPTSCFGETEYYVSGVRLIGGNEGAPPPAPPATPPTPGTSSSAPATTPP
jgi:hypothetical protein